MNQADDTGYGLWELAVLATLREGPQHPYAIARLLRERHKHDVLVLKRGSLYHAIRRLAAAGLIAAGRASRQGRRPERTPYALTRAGDAALSAWLRHLVAEPRAEPASFMGAMSFLIHLEPEAAMAALAERIDRLQHEIAEYDERIAAVGGRIGRIHLIESEYARAIRVAEAAWIRALLADLRAGRLTWDLKAILRQMRAIHDRRARTARRPGRKA